MAEKGLLIVLSAPSGCGKSTIIAELLKKRPLFFSVSATTRDPREGEINGKDYYFVTREKFADMVDNGEFLEHAEYVGNCYGTPKAPVEKMLAEGKDVLLEIDVNGAMQVREKAPGAVLIFILPPSLEELERRLVRRGTDSMDVIRSRLDTAKHECESADKYDFYVVNDSVERAVSELDALIEAQKKSKFD